MEFDWLPLTWDAVAIFLTGLFAVGGAVFVGRKQVAITRSQNLIQQQLADDDRRLRQQTIKLALLERRSDCLDRLQELLSVYQAKAELESGDQRELYHLLRQSQLIFPKSVVDGMEDVLDDSGRQRVAYKQQQSLRIRGKETEADKVLNRAIDLEHKIFDRLPALVEAMISSSRITEDWE